METFSANDSKNICNDESFVEDLLSRSQSIDVGKVWY